MAFSKHASQRFMAAINDTTVEKTPNPIDIDDKFPAALTALWDTTDQEEQKIREEWIKNIIAIFGDQQWDRQTTIMETDADKFTKFAYSLQNLILFMTHKMPEHKQELLSALTTHFYNYCFITDTLDYNHATIICNAIAFFYEAIPFNESSPLQTIIPPMHPSLTSNELKQQYILQALQKIQHNFPHKNTDSAHLALASAAQGSPEQQRTKKNEYIGLQSRLFECILLRLRVIGVEITPATGALAFPREIDLFLDKLCTFDDTRTPSTISLWLSNYNPSRSISRHLEEQALTNTTATTTAQFLTQLEEAITNKNLNDPSSKSITDKAQIEGTSSILEALVETQSIIERNSTTRGASHRRQAFYTSRNIEKAQKQIEKYLQLCRIIPTEQLNAFYSMLDQTCGEAQAQLFLQAGIYLYSTPLFKKTTIKAPYTNSTWTNPKSLYHPKLHFILQQWIDNITSLPPELSILLKAQKQKWATEEAPPMILFANLAKLILENLIFPEYLITQDTLTEKERKTYLSLLNFSKLTPFSSSSTLTSISTEEDETTLMQNMVTCLRANPALWENFYQLITQLTDSDNLPAFTDINSAFQEHIDTTLIFDGPRTLGAHLLTPTLSSRTPAIPRSLPPPAEALNELFRQSYIDELSVTSPYTLGENLDKAFKPLLSDILREDQVDERIQTIRAYIVYMSEHPDFSYREWIKPERAQEARNTNSFSAARQEDHNHNTKPIIQLGLNKFLTHLIDSIDEYATHASSKGRWKDRAYTASICLLLIGALVAEAAARYRIEYDRSGTKISKEAWYAIGIGSYIGAFVIGTTSMIIKGSLLSAKRVNRMKMQETVAELNGEPSPHRTKMFALSITSSALTLGAMISFVYIFKGLLPRLDAQTNVADDDTPAAKEIDILGPISNSMCLLMCFMTGVSAVINYHTITTGRNNDWFRCHRNPTTDTSHHETEMSDAMLFRPAITPSDDTRRSLLANTGRNYGSAQVHPSGIAKRSAYATAMTRNIFESDSDTEGNTRGEPIRGEP